jgi:hypothetical protein
MRVLEACSERKVWRPACRLFVTRDALKRAHRTILLALACLLAAPVCGAGANQRNTADYQRKAIMMGGDPFHDPGSHPERARRTFLRLVGNLENDPAKGWTCDMDWDLKVRFGMNPTNTSAEALFIYIGQHHLGYRIAMSCGPAGHTLGYWRCATDNGIMPFAPHGFNSFVRLDEPPGLGAAVSVAGGTAANVTTYGPGLEFIEAVPEWAPQPKYEDTAQSWANQGLAAKFAHVLDAHPKFNIWDAREYLRQAASCWPTGWTETNGYGRVNERTIVGKLQPGPPVEFQAVRSRSRREVRFTWLNFAQTDFAATVIARGDGRVIYDGAGTNFVWTSDVDGSEAFTYWARNKAGEKSRMETYQTRTVTGLSCKLNQTCLMLSAPASSEGPPFKLGELFQQVATNWVCDMVSATGVLAFDAHTQLPRSPLVALLPDLSAMISFAISNDYRILVAPIAAPDQDLFAYKSAWDRATAAGMLVVLPHHSSLATSRAPKARRLSPPRLFSAITVGEGTTTNQLSFGPGLEFFDAPTQPGAAAVGFATQTDAAAVVAGKLAQVLDAHPGYNSWDARQHLRQSASLYAAGWVEDGGYGRPPARPARIAALDPAPPLDIQATISPRRDGVTFSWLNFRQSNWAGTVIQRKDGRTIYQGSGTNFVWRSDVEGEETFRFFSRDRSGRLSRAETYTVIPIQGLHRGS